MNNKTIKNKKIKKPIKDKKIQLYVTSAITDEPQYKTRLNSKTLKNYE
jgi:hypothetical protein